MRLLGIRGSGRRPRHVPAAGASESNPRRPRERSSGRGDVGSGACIWVELREALSAAYGAAERPVPRWDRRAARIGVDPDPGGAPDGASRRGTGDQPACWPRRGSSCGYHGWRQSVREAGTGAKSADAIPILSRQLLAVTAGGRAWPRGGRPPSERRDGPGGVGRVPGVKRLASQRSRGARNDSPSTTC